MTEHSNSNQQTPSFAQAFLCFSTVIAIIAGGLYWLEVSLHSLMFSCIVWSALHAYWLGYNYSQIRDFMSTALTRALPAIYIFILIGMVISSFMHSGTIAALIHLGLSWLRPSLFLAFGMVLCAIMSLATGTSWGTVGTLGVVFIGIGSAMGIPLPLVAGMVVCGATFGDKMSPISDTTNLAAMSAETNLYRHIYAMIFTTAPSFAIAFVIFLIMGSNYADQTINLASVSAIQSALSLSYKLNPVVTLLPLIVLATLSFRKSAPEVAMVGSIVTAVLIAWLYQGDSAAEILNALWQNSKGQTGITNLDNLLGRGGISSMSWTLILALMAIALGGILHSTGILEKLLAGIIDKVKSTPALIATTIGTSFMGNLAMGEAYISIILNCQLFRDKYKQNKLDSAVLSRSVEEGSTMTTALIPWTTAGAFYAVTLGVDVLDYAPYAFFNYLNAVVSVSLAAAGVGLLKKARV